MAFLRRAMFFVGRAVKTRQNVQNGPKISCGTHLLLECCMLIGLLGWGKLDLIRALNQSNIWRLCYLIPFYQVASLLKKVTPNFNSRQFKCGKSEMHWLRLKLHKALG